MNSKIEKLITVTALVLTFCLSSLAQPAAAQTPVVAVSAGWSKAQTKEARPGFSFCKQAKGYFFDTLDLNFGGTLGTITNGGILNGTTETVYNPAAVFTPDPNVVSYIGELTITTQQGQLKTSNVYIYNFASGLWTAMGRINPETSTGRFAGATGVLYFNGSTTGAFPDESYPSQINGEICLASE